MSGISPGINPINPDTHKDPTTGQVLCTFRAGRTSPLCTDHAVWHVLVDVLGDGTGEGYGSLYACDRHLQSARSAHTPTRTATVLLEHKATWKCRTGGQFTSHDRLEVFCAGDLG